MSSQVTPGAWLLDSFRASGLPAENPLPGLHPIQAMLGMSVSGMIV